MITIEVGGIEGAQEILARLQALGNTVESAEVLGHTRKPQPRLTARRRKSSKSRAALNNAQVLKYMAMPPGNRDFYSMSKAETEKVVNKVFVKKLVEGFEGTKKSTARRARVRGMKSVGALAGGDFGKLINIQMNWARNVMGKALRAACMSYLRWITEKILTQNWRGMGGDLSPEYAEYKMKLYGLTHPIGKATGQLIDNVAPSSKNIKLRMGSEPESEETSGVEDDSQP